MTLPTGFAEKYTQLLGSDAPAFLNSFNQPFEKGYRLDPLHPSGRSLVAADAVAVPWANDGFFGTVHGADPAFWTGAVYSQEPSAMAVGPQLHAQPGERVLDVAAAPGGKTTDIIGQMNDQGMLVSNDIDRSRAKILAENVERWGAAHTVVTSATPSQLRQSFPGFFDRILLDAPCSGEGMFRKDPSAMQYWHPDYPAECAHRQREILRDVLPMLKTGGDLVYSTCTFAPEEDEQIIAWLLQTYPGLSVVPIPLVGGMVAGRPEWADGNPDLAGCARLFPNLVRGEGHFVAHLHFSGVSEPDAQPAKRHEKNRHAAGFSHALTKAEQSLLAAFWEDTFNTPVPVAASRWGNQIIALPPAYPASAAKLKIMRPGLIIADIKGHRLVPNHALALAIPRDQWRFEEPVDLGAANQYRHGETLPTTMTGRHWVLMTYAASGFAVGHAVNGTIKNFYPKGLRI